MPVIVQRHHAFQADISEMTMLCFDHCVATTSVQKLVGT